MELFERKKLNKSSTCVVDASYTFPKSLRFRSYTKEKSCGFYTIPTAFDKRSCTFGSGKRSELVIETCSPPPDRYNPKLSKPTPITISKSGLGERSRLFIKPFPGPGDYSITPTEGGPKYTMFQKYPKKPIVESPCAANYNPNFKATQESKFSTISFGIGEKSPTLKVTDAPGPGSYNLPNIFTETIKKARSFNELTRKMSSKKILKKINNS